MQRTLSGGLSGPSLCPTSRAGSGSLAGTRISGRQAGPARPDRLTVVETTALTQLTATQLPATHVEASMKALDQMRRSSNVNRYAMEKKSSIIAIGLSVHQTPVDIREQLSIAEAEWPRAIAELVAYPHIEEAAVLSTCNRMELYIVALSRNRGIREVEEWMSRSSGLPLQGLMPHLFCYTDRDATEHLLRVAGGLDSLVMGEGQILAQVKQVYKVGQDCPGFGRHLNALFKQAITGGKRVRSETSIASGAVSVSSAAAELAQLKLPSHSFDGARVCIIGAGKMSKLLLKHLASKGCREVLILNRSFPRAEALAAEFPEVKAELRLMPELMRSVAESDVIFAASSSEHILINGQDLQGMPTAGDAVGNVRRFFDIAVPRNIGSNVNDIEHSRVFNVDDLKEVVEANKEERRKAAGEAEVLLHQEQLAFEAWRDSLETVPTIKALRSKAEAIRAAELDKVLSKCGEGMSKKQVRAVEELSRAIVNKLLHGPMTALRCDGSDPTAVGETLANMDALERMFELSRFELPVAASSR